MYANDMIGIPKQQQNKHTKIIDIGRSKQQKKEKKKDMTKSSNHAQSRIVNK